MRAITKITKAALITTLAVVSFVSAAQQKTSFDAERVGRELAAAMMSGNGDYQTAQEKKSLKSNETVAYFVAAAQSSEAKKHEQDRGGGVLTLNQRRAAAKEAVSLLDEERLPYFQESVLFLSVSGEQKNLAMTARDACVVMIDPTETKALWEEVSPDAKIEEKIFRKFIAQHELSHCMYVEKRKTQGGITTVEDVMSAVGVNGVANQTKFKALFEKEKGLEEMEELVREAYADVYAVMSAAKNDWTKNWSVFADGIEKFRSNTTSASHSEGHDTSFALKMLKEYDESSLKSMSGKEREALAEKLAIRGVWQALSANVLSSEIKALAEVSMQMQVKSSAVVGLHADRQETEEQQPSNIAARPVGIRFGR
jgi:hypothetical protein